MGDLTIGTLTVSTVARIADASGLLSNAPYRGDLVPMDFQPGGVWLGGEEDVWSFDVPLLMKGATEGELIANLRSVQAVADGTEKRITRTFTSGTTATTESCDGVVTSVTPVWDFAMRPKLTAIVMVQVTSGDWVTGT